MPNNVIELGSSGASQLNDLTDVNCPAPVDGHELCYDGTAGEWVCQPKPPASSPLLLRTESTADVTASSFSFVPFGGNIVYNPGGYTVVSDGFVVPDPTLVYDVRVVLKFDVPELGALIPISMFWSGSSRNVCQLVAAPTYQLNATWAAGDYVFPANRSDTAVQTLEYGCKILLDTTNTIQIRFGGIVTAAQSFANLTLRSGSFLEVCSIGPAV